MGDGSSWHQFGVIRLEERGPVRLKKYVVTETKPVEVPELEAVIARVATRTPGV